LTWLTGSDWLPALPEAVTRRSSTRIAIRVIRFTAPFAGQCSAARIHLPDWVVCDTIANGSRRTTGLRGIHGGPILRFEKRFPGNRQGSGKSTVALLGEVTRMGCYTLRLLRPARPGKIWSETGFLNRAEPK
jgi:hypothetical protein